MSCKTSAPARVTVVVISITVVMIFLVVADAAQQRSIAPSSAESSATSVTLQARMLSRGASIRKGLTSQLDAGSVSFLQAVTYSSGGPCSNSVAIADVNRDGNPDILIANGCPDWYSQGQEGSVSVLLGKGNGTFQAAVAYDAGGVYPTSLAVADLNDDGNPDVLVANQCVSAACPSGAIAVLLGNGDGTLHPPVTYEVEGNAVSLVVGDLNKDGKSDLVVTQCPTGCTGLISVLLGNGDGTLHLPVTYRAGVQAVSVVLSDVNSDGNLDVIVAEPCSDVFCPVGVVEVLLGNGDGTLQPAVTYESGGHLALSVASTDVNADGRADLLVANSQSSSEFGGSAGVLLGNGDGTFGSATTYPSGADVAVAIAAADINGDDTSDLIMAHCTQGTKISWACPNPNDGGTVAVLAGNGDGTFKAPVVYRSGGIGATSVAVSDVNGDKLPDIVVAHRYMTGWNGPGAVGVLLNNSPLLRTTTILSSSPNPSSVGQAVTFAATVTSSAGIPPNGETITFKNGAAILGTAPLSGGMASLTTSSFSAGTYTITASYPGDSKFGASTSAGLRQVVNSTTKSATSTTLVSSLNPSIYGQKITFTATVTTTGSLPPTGTVDFTWSDGFRVFNIGAATVNSSGIATLIRSNLNADPYPLKATYHGDTNNLASTSPILNQTVLQTTSAAALTSSVNPSRIGQAITFTAEITSPTVTPSGPVTFKAGTTVLGTAQLSRGKATFTTSTLPAGSTVVKVIYNGDSNIKGSSASVTQTVQP